VLANGIPSAVDTGDQDDATGDALTLDRWHVRQPDRVADRIDHHANRGP
jgi:hypothetical protein